MTSLKCEGKMSIQGRSCELRRKLVYHRWKHSVHELAVLEVIYSDLDNDEDPPKIQRMSCAHRTCRGRWCKLPQCHIVTVRQQCTTQIYHLWKKCLLGSKTEENPYTSLSLWVSTLALREAPRNQSFSDPIRRKRNPRCMHMCILILPVWPGEGHEEVGWWTHF